MMNQKSNPIAKVYAQALFELAKEKNELEPIFLELKEINKYFSENKKIYIALSSDAFLLVERIRLAVEFCKLAGVRPVLAKLIELLVSKGRLPALAMIEATYMDLIDQSQGIVRGVVTTVDPLIEGEIDGLSKAFSKKLSKKVLLNQALDKSMLGGLIVDVGGLTFDGSLKTSIRKIKENLERQFV